MKLKNIATILSAIIIAMLCICAYGCTENVVLTPPAPAEEEAADIDVHNAPTTVYDVHNAPVQAPEKIDYTADVDLSTPVVIEESRENPGEYVIIDNRDFTYTLKSIDPEGYEGGYEFLFELKNHSGRPITVVAESFIINGWLINHGEVGHITAEAHTTEEYSVICGNIAEGMLGSTSVDEIRFDVYYSDYHEWVWESDRIIGRYVIYPGKKSPENIKYAEITLDEDDVVVVDNSELTFVIKGIYNGEWMLVAAENKTDYTITCGTRYRKVHSLGGDGNISTHGIPPHSCRCFTLFFNRGNHNVLPAEFSFELIADKIISTDGYRDNKERVARTHGYYTLTEANVDKLEWME